MRKPTNIGASVRARLANLARQRQQPFQVLLTRYVLERLLYRLSTTPHRERFVLKGAMLLTSWFTDPLRPTQDLDLLGFGNSDASKMLEVSRNSYCSTGRGAGSRRSQVTQMYTSHHRLAGILAHGCVARFTCALQRQSRSLQLAICWLRMGAKGASTMRLGEPFVGFPLANASAIFWSN